MKKIKTATVALGAAAAAGALAYGIPAIASAASSSPNPTPSSGSSTATPEQRSQHAGAEAEVTGTDADKIKAAVTAKLGAGSTVHRISAEDAAEGTGAAYEAHAAKADGSRVEVLLDKSFVVTAVKADAHRGGPGGRHGGHEAEVIGANADKVKAAVLAKLPGATVEHVSAEDPAEGTGAVYEAHVIKVDGTHARVLLSGDFAVTAVDTAPAGGPRGGHHGGPPAGGSSSTPSTSGSANGAAYLGSA